MKKEVFGIILVVMVVSLMLVFPRANPTGDTQNSWLSGWEYRKSHVIGSAPGTGQNYTIEITVINGTSTDSGDTVYINNKMRSDFGDIRFTEDDGVTQLSYWIETENDQQNATFWVKIPDDLSTSNVTIYMYYGAPNATTTSNVDNTFIFGDDFEGNLSKWSIIRGDCETSTDYAYEGSKCLECGTGASNVNNLDNWSNVAVHVRFYDSLAPGMEEQILFADSIAESATAGVSTDIDPTHYIYQIGNSYPIGTSYYVSNILRTVGWHSLVVRCCATGEEIVIDGNVQPYTSDVNSVTSNGCGSFWITNAEVGYFDAFFVCKYVNPEPQNGAWGIEEIAPTGTGTLPGAQWYLWTSIALGITTAVFAYTTFHYWKKTVTRKKSKSVVGKPLSRESKTCPNCGANLPADSKFCGKCGTSLEQNSPLPK